MIKCLHYKKNNKHEYERKVKIMINKFSRRGIRMIVSLVLGVICTVMPIKNSAIIYSNSSDTSTMTPGLPPVVEYTVTVTTPTTSTTTTSLTTTTRVATTMTTTQHVTTTVSKESSSLTHMKTTTTVEPVKSVPAETVIENVVETEPFICYKPSTQYVHMSTCRWYDNSCYEISDTSDIEARLCSECNPEIEIMNPIIETTTEVTSSSNISSITDTEFIMLANVVGGEYGSDWVSIYDKACVVACVMNRYYDGGWTGGRDNTIYNVITAPGQFYTYYANSYYNSNVTESCKAAVTYYFEHQSEFPHITSFYGDGTRNYFR